MLGRGEPRRLGAGANRAAPGEMLFAIAGNGGIMAFLRSCVWRDAISIPSNPQKSWMHPCVRCVSELLARCVASQPRNLSFRATGSGMILIFRSRIRGGGLGAPCDHAFDCDWVGDGAVDTGVDGRAALKTVLGMPPMGM